MLNMDNRGKFEGEGGSFLIGNSAVWSCWIWWK